MHDIMVIYFLPGLSVFLLSFLMVWMTNIYYSLSILIVVNFIVYKLLILLKLQNSKNNKNDFIYICCCLHDTNVIEFIRNNLNKNPRPRIWLNTNAYNIIGKGGCHYNIYKDEILEYLKLVCNTDELINIEDARQYNIYCVNGHPAFNNTDVLFWYKNNGYNKVNFNLFGLKKVILFLKTAGCINDKEYKELDGVFSLKLIENKKEKIYEEVKALNELLNLLNNSLKKLELLKNIPAEEAIIEWQQFWKDLNYQNLIEKHKEFIAKIMDEPKEKGTTYTQMQKAIDSITIGPLLPHDHLGMLIASYIHTNDLYNDTLSWNNIHDPVALKNNKVIIPSKDSNNTEFNHFLYKVLKIINFDKNLYLPDVIYHDCEEDDIATMQYIAKYKPRFECNIQYSKRNANIMKYLDNMVPKSVTINKKMFELSQRAELIIKWRDLSLKKELNQYNNSQNCYWIKKFPDLNYAFLDFEINNTGNSSKEDNKPKKAIIKCKNSFNSF